MKIAEEAGKHGLCNVSSWTFRMHCQRRLYSKYLWVQMERYRNTNRPLTMSNYRSNAIGVINMATLVESRLPEGNQGKTELEHEKEESVPMEEKKSDSKENTIPVEQEAKCWQQDKNEAM